MRVMRAVRRVLYMDRVEQNVRRGPRQRFPLSHRFPEYLAVHRYHDHTRYPEGHTRRYDRVYHIGFEDAHIWVSPSVLPVFFSRVPPHEDWHEAYERWPQPDVSEHKTDGSVRHRDGILQRSDDCVVPRTKQRFVLQVTQVE